MAESYERVFICVDDTDDLTLSTSTGGITEEIVAALEKEFGAKVNMGITRHQIFLDETVPYTSHNSSMCFDILLPAGSAPRIEEMGGEKIRSLSAESANPGLCILPVPGDEAPGDTRLRYAALIRFGMEAKERYISCGEAVRMAERFPEMILRWDGETGQGRVGALAGIGLHMSGEDGRFRGKLKLTELTDSPVLNVGELALLIRDRYGTAPVFTDEDGNKLDDSKRMILTDRVKAFMIGGRLCILCMRAEDMQEWSEEYWIAHTRETLDRDPDYKRAEENMRKRQSIRQDASPEGLTEENAGEGCPYFETDPDEEERFDEDLYHACGSCLYRRLTADGYICSAGHEMPARTDKLRDCDPESML